MSRTSFIERYVMPAALKIGGQKHVLSVRDGIILNMLDWPLYFQTLFIA